MLEELFPSYDQCGRQAVQMKYLSLPFSSKITDSKHWKSSRITSTFTREHLNSGTRNPAASNPFKRWGFFWCVLLLLLLFSNCEGSTVVSQEFWTLMNQSL